jgi:hypothetical protein
VEAVDRLAYPGSVPERPVGGAANLPPDVPPEYVEEYLRGYERAYAEAAGLATAGEPDEPTDTVEQAGEEPAEPWRFEPPDEPPGVPAGWEPEPTLTWAFEPPQEPAAEGRESAGDPDDGDAQPTDTMEQEAVHPDDDTADDADADEAAVVPGFVLWEGRDERYDEPPDVEGSPRWVMPFLAVCVIVLLFVAIYLLA